MSRDRDTLGYLVPLAEITEQIAAGSPPLLCINWAARLNITVDTDWAGREAVHPEDARRIVQAFRSTTDQKDIEWQQHQADCDEWVRLRTTAVAAVPVHDPPGREQAGADFERNNPRPIFHGQPTVPLAYDDNSRRAGWAHKVTDAMRQLWAADAHNEDDAGVPA